LDGWYVAVHLLGEIQYLYLTTNFCIINKLRNWRVGMIIPSDIASREKK